MTKKDIHGFTPEQVARLEVRQYIKSRDTCQKYVLLQAAPSKSQPQHPPPAPTFVVPDWTKLIPTMDQTGLILLID